ncbi:hypothetical protein C2869_15395 [Saccharobesus litoralis]|uniref:DUF2066 domain-containing protein n=1 Tax=Saccharobesus litoralis TaxID=2172099 RepID=A0A2S0VU47_9ALTE|nr:DUF2066 domain-containing protein [Saccharobesus litoralis]AWB67738.1 hypothetical protein C2869_15395 [Saccharobesus litoralis]
MIKKQTILLALVLIALFSSFSFAVEVAGLYQSKIEVEQQSQAERVAAYRKGLANVLIRVSGKQNINQDDAFKLAVRNPTKYLARYQYETLDEKLYLLIDFNPKAVNALLRNNETAIWGSLRPLTMVWIATQGKGFERDIMNEDNPFYVDVLRPIAKERGLPMIAPLMDFDDATMISASDVWGKFEEPIKLASARYDPDVISAIKVFQQDDNINTLVDASWLAQITLYNLASPMTLEVSGTSAQQVTQEAIHAIADAIGEQYAVAAQAARGDQNYLYLTFSNVAGMKATLTVESFLNSLSSVSQARVHQINGLGVQYQVELLGEALDVFTALDLDERVRPFKPEFGEEMPTEHYFVWTNTEN